ncbi:hypothetical protein [Rhabdothermincola salaria]|uniref:hypothetical protein n=1 Tax=Rhabdothermincola salaria TaxID=2903142 RepID=UPI001E5E0E46|nr:hypothetical protein [Rhabdothermincola salaria]MCD9624269.1 hypothetical protein [Rhabdothermincola salaria]
MATPEQSRPPRTGPAPDSLARSVPEPSPDHLGPEPEENRPGHHPAEEQDQPPLDDFAAKFGIPPEVPSDDGGVGSDAAEARSDDGEARSADAPSRGRGRASEASGASAGHEDVSDDDPDSAGGHLPRQVRTVWVVTARRGVLPALGGVRAVTDALERIVRRTL